MLDHMTDQRSASLREEKKKQWGWERHQKSRGYYRSDQGCALFWNTAHSTLLFSSCTAYCLQPLSNSCSMYKTHAQTHTCRQKKAANQSACHLQTGIWPLHTAPFLFFFLLHHFLPLLSSCFMGSMPSGQRFIPKQRHNHSQTIHLTSPHFITFSERYSALRYKDHLRHCWLISNI